MRSICSPPQSGHPILGSSGCSPGARHSGRLRWRRPTTGPAVGGSGRGPARCRGRRLRPGHRAAATGFSMGHGRGRAEKTCHGEGEEAGGPQPGAHRVPEAYGLARRRIGRRGLCRVSGSAPDPRRASRARRPVGRPRQRDSDGPTRGRSDRTAVRRGRWLPHPTLLCARTGRASARHAAATLP